MVYFQIHLLHLYLHTFFYSSTDIKIDGMKHSFKECSRIHIDKDTNFMANQFSACGVSIWSECNVQLDSEINISNLNGES